MKKYDLLINLLEKENDLLALFKVKGQYFWYILEKPYFYLDYGDTDIYGEDYRFSIITLDQHTVEKFISLTEDFRIDIDYLRNTFKDFHELIEQGGYIGFLLPNVYLDFDSHCAHFCITELLFISLLPADWTASWNCVFFTDIIPDSQKYWVIDGVDWSTKIKFY